MIIARIEWNGPQRTEEIRLTLREWVQRATVFLWEKIQETLNVPNTGERRKHRTRKTKSGRAASYTVYPHPSQPGEAPRKRTGWLQRNVLYEVTPDGVGRVGVTINAKYGAYLELGTRRMQPRPWLVATVRANLDRLRAMIREGAQ